MRNYEDIFERLLSISDSAHVGPAGNNALHAAVRNGNSVIAKRIMETCPKLAREEEIRKNTPMHHAVLWNRTNVLRVLLEHDHSLGYVVSTDGTTLLNTAAFRGHVDAAQEILNHCPDAPYRNIKRGSTCLHTAIHKGHVEFVQFVLGSRELRKLVNMRDKSGRTALFLSVEKCNPRIVAALLLHHDTDVTVLSKTGTPAVWTLPDALTGAKSLNWNEVSMLMLKADPERKESIYNLHKEIKDKIIDKSRKDVKSLTETYTRNTSIVAIFMASISFTAAFTVSGWYRSDVSSHNGLPIMAKKFAFQAFLLSDTLAVCSSLCVAFICIIARWEDFEFLLYYRSFTQRLMWFAYMATSIAFACGLYTVLAPDLLWLAITIIILSVPLPIATVLLGSWPQLKLWIRLHRTFKSDLLDLV